MIKSHAYNRQKKYNVVHTIVKRSTMLYIQLSKEAQCHAYNCLKEAQCHAYNCPKKHNVMHTIVKRSTMHTIVKRGAADTLSLSSVTFSSFAFLAWLALLTGK